MAKEILIGCEESGTVTAAFRSIGINAYSCDILPTSGPHPEYHYQEDIFKVLRGGNFAALIAFPPCTHLTNAGARFFEIKRANGQQQQALNFFKQLYEYPIDKICLENPVGIVGTHYIKPTQIIQPFYFGEPYQKTTCLWLKNLPKLWHNGQPNLFNEKITHVKINDGFYTWTCKKTGRQKRQPLWYYKAAFLSAKKGERQKARSKTFPGIAQAMAEQWSAYI